MLPNEIDLYKVYNKQTYLPYKEKLELLLESFSKSDDKLSRNYTLKNIDIENLDDITLIVYEDNIVSFASVLSRPIWPKNTSRIFNRMFRNKQFNWSNPTFGIISKLTHDHQIEYCKNAGKDFVFLSIEGRKRNYLKRWTEQANEYSPGWLLCDDKKWVCQGTKDNCLQHITYKKLSTNNISFLL